MSLVIINILGVIIFILQLSKIISKLERITVLLEKEEFLNSTHLEANSVSHDYEPNLVFKTTQELESWLNNNPLDLPIETQIASLENFIEICKSKEQYEYAQVAFNKIKELKSIKQ